MPIILGEPSGPQPTTVPLMVVGPYTWQGALSANSLATFCYPRAATYQSANYSWNFLSSPLAVRGISGVVNANAVAAASTLTLAVFAQASAVNGTETGATVAGTSLSMAGGTTGFFSLTYANPVLLPTVAGGGTMFGANLIATAAGNVDALLWLHMEA